MAPVFDRLATGLNTNVSYLNCLRSRKSAPIMGWRCNVPGFLGNNDGPTDRQTNQLETELLYRKSLRVFYDFYAISKSRQNLNNKVRDTLIQADSSLMLYIIYSLCCALFIFVFLSIAFLCDFLWTGWMLLTKKSRFSCVQRTGLLFDWS